MGLLPRPVSSRSSDLVLSVKRTGLQSGKSGAHGHEGAQPYSEGK